MIPRLAHFFWFGGDTPAWATANAMEFSRFNPSWDVTVYHQWGFSPDLQLAVNRCHLWCQVADIAYLDVLRRMGGIVLDCDTLTIRSFEPLLDRASPWTTQHPPAIGGPRRLTNGVMGAAPGSPSITEACAEVASIARHGEGQFRRTQFGPALLTEFFSDDGMNILPHHYFYPWGLLLGEREEAHKFWKADQAERDFMLAQVSDRFTDDQWPFAVHLWGVDGSGDEEIPE